MKSKENRTPLNRKQFVKRLNGLFVEIENKQLKFARDLVSFKKTDWAKLILKTKIPIPGGKDKLSEYAEEISKRIRESYPTQSVAEMITRNDLQVIKKSVEKFCYERVIISGRKKSNNIS